MQQDKEGAQAIANILSISFILFAFASSACMASEDNTVASQAPSESAERSAASPQGTLTLSTKHPAFAIADKKIIRKSTFLSPAIREIRKGNSREIKAYAIKANPKNKRIVYAATEEGLFKSIDKGKTFRKVYPEDIKKNVPVYDVSVFYNDSWIVCVASDEGALLSRRSGYWLRNITKSLGEFKARVVEIHPYKRRVIFAGTKESLYRTQDGGRTWVKVLDEEVTKIIFDRDNPRRVRLETKNGPLASSDSGISYTVLVSKNEK